VAVGEAFNALRPLLERSIILDRRSAAWLLTPSKWGAAEAFTICLMAWALIVLLLAMVIE